MFTPWLHDLVIDDLDKVTFVRAVDNIGALVVAVTTSNCVQTTMIIVAQRIGHAKNQISSPKYETSEPSELTNTTSVTTVITVVDGS